MRICTGPDFQTQCILYGKQQNSDCAVCIAVKRTLVTFEQLNSDCAFLYYLHLFLIEPVSSHIIFRWPFLWNQQIFVKIEVLGLWFLVKRFSNYASKGRCSPKVFALTISAPFGSLLRPWLVAKSMFNRFASQLQWIGQCERSCDWLRLWRIFHKFYSWCLPRADDALWASVY